MYFRNPTGTVNSDRAIAFSLGSTWDVFRRAATPGDPSANSVIYLGNINSFLANDTAPPFSTPSETGGYGSDWTSLSSSIWVGAVGNNGSANAASSSTSNQDYARTLYLTKPRSGAGSYQAANSTFNDNLAGYNTTFQGATASTVAGIGGPFIGVMTNDVPRSVGNLNSTIDDQNPISSGVAGKAYNNFVTGGTMGQISASTYTYGSISNVVIGLDLYRLTPVLNASGWQNLNNIAGVTAGQGYYLGTITLSSDGTVHFVGRADATPPPPDDYTAWAAGYSRADLTDKEGDYDRDGFKNVAEYAFGTDPTVGNSALSSATVVSNNLTVGFFRRSTANDQAPAYSVFSSTDLANAFTNNGASISILTNVAPAGYQAASFTQPVSGSKIFYRIKATLPQEN